jgi:hypothetical protein
MRNLGAVCGESRVTGPRTGQPIRAPSEGVSDWLRRLAASTVGVQGLRCNHISDRGCYQIWNAFGYSHTPHVLYNVHHGLRVCQVHLNSPCLPTQCTLSLASSRSLKASEMLCTGTMQS